MKIIRGKKVALAGAGLVALGIGIAVPTMAFAQDPTPSPPGTTATADPGTDRAQREADRRDRMAELLANELGLDKATVADALSKVQDQMRSDAKTEHRAQLEQRLADAVTAGTITQEEADAILKASDAGVLPGGGMRGPGHRGGGR